jgi:hypothetical protein
MGIENRRHPRYSARVELGIRGLQIYTNNVSISGFQCSCPTMLMGILLPEDAGGAMDATAKLPDGTVCRFNARVAYLTDYGDEFLIGAQITAFESDGEEIFARYLASLAARSAARGAR